MEQEPVTTPAVLAEIYLRICELKHQLERYGASTPAPANAPVRMEHRLGVGTRNYLRLLCHPDRYTYKEMANLLQCQVSTLRTYYDRLTKRYGLKGRGALRQWAREHELDR